MCGIAGIVNLTCDAPVSLDELRAMAGALVHRGPDDEGYFIDASGRCGLAFRRLAIIDLEGGRQPIGNEDGAVQLVFNGEVYNYRALRAGLETQGHRFATQSDSEVIAHLFEELGDACFERMHGMFAAAIWDARRGRLVLVRDRLGKKPLICATHAGRLYFASEAKALAAVRGIAREIDPQALHRYLLFQYVPAPHAAYRGFFKLRPGHRLTIDPGAARSLEQRPFWRPPTPAPFAGSYDDARERLGELLTAAVRKRLIADVPLGAFLSGGIDSSLVVALMRELGVSPLRTFSIGFPDARYDETRYARIVARRFETEHHEHVVTPRAREALDTLAYHYDEPFADSSAIPTYYVSRWTRESVTVALCGDGGDECFAGYERYRGMQAAARLDRWPRTLRRLAAAAGGLLPRRRAKSLTNRLARFASALALPPARRYLAWVSVFPAALLAMGYRDEFAARIDFDEPLRWFDGLFEPAPGPDANRAVHADLASYLPYDLLTKVDIASMANSLECRSPFLDHELLEFALSLPLEWRIGRGGKAILKDWAAARLPAEILNRPKMGFGVPIGEWLRRELRDVAERLCEPAAHCARIFRAEWLRDLVKAHVDGRANFEHPLWALVMLELWLERWRPTGL